MGTRPELALAGAILLAALGVDLLWLRPQERELRTLLERRDAAEQAAAAADRKRLEASSLAEYVSRGTGGSPGWLDAYRDADPLPMLERIRIQSGLRRLDLRLGQRESLPPFTRTTYFMSVQGSFAQQLRFLKALELAKPLVLVDSFTMATGIDDPKVTASLDVSVLGFEPGGEP